MSQERYCTSTAALTTANGKRAAQLKRRSYHEHSAEQKA